MPSSNTKSGNSSNDERELFVANDYQTIPAGELRAILPSFAEWLSIVARRKLGSVGSSPQHVSELKRWVKGDRRQISKRILKSFESLRDSLSHLAFSPTFYATVPAVGPLTQGIMGMSRSDGTLHVIAHQAVAQVGGKVVDTGHFRFISWLEDETPVITVSRMHAPSPRQGVDQVIVMSDDIETVLKKHRQRARSDELKTVPPSDLFEHAEAENHLTIEDLVQRGVLRLATPGEVARIRNQA